MADFNKSAILGYTDDMSNTLKNIALASLAAGAAAPLVKDLLRPEHPLILPTSSGAYSSIPVPESSMSEALPEYKRPVKKRSTKSVKELKNFNLAGSIKDVSEKRSSDWTRLYKYLTETSDLAQVLRGTNANPIGASIGDWTKRTMGHLSTNPYFLPGAVVATAVPMMAGHALSKSLINKRDLDDKKDDTADAKEEFAKALLEAQTGSPVRQVIKAGSGNRDIDELYENLEKLASVALDDNEKKASWFNKYVIDPVAGLIPNGRENLQRAGGAWNLMSEAVYGRPDQDPKTYNPLQYVFSGAPGAAAAAIDTAKAIPEATDKLWNAFKTYGGKGLTGAGGAMLAAGLLAGGAGTYYGHRAAKNEDKDTEESYKYLSEFLRRQQEEGTPISITPVPVVPKVKKPWYSIG
jgi:hypothetical protein